MSTAEFFFAVVLKPRILRRAVNEAIKAVLPRVRNVHGARISLNPNDPVISGALTFGVYENEEIRFFRRHFSAGMTLIDVGANIGLYTGLALAGENPAGTILAVEPHAESRSFLEQTILMNRNPLNQNCRMIISSEAAYDSVTMVSFYLNSSNKGDNRIYADPLLDQQTRIQTDTLDEIARRAGVFSVDFLKLDTQGAEAHVIRGATALLEGSPRCVLMTEFWPYGLAACGDDAGEYLRLLEKLGFRLFELRGGKCEPFEPGELIRRTSGRKYANLVGFKGKGGRT